MPISEVNSENSSLSSAPFYATEFPMSKKQKCQNCCRICCFNVWHCRCHKRDLTLGDRPMYRDDVFYGSNVSRMKYSDDEIINYHLSVTRIPDAREVTEHLQQKCCVCHHAFLRTCLTMTGLNLLKSKIFAFLCISSFFYTMALYMPYVFIKGISSSCVWSGNVLRAEVTHPFIYFRFWDAVPRTERNIRVVGLRHWHIKHSRKIGQWNY